LDAFDRNFPDLSEDEKGAIGGALEAGADDAAPGTFERLGLIPAASPAE
jgi:hypothetical protein